jgi:general secretion pathway protein A
MLEIFGFTKEPFIHPISPSEIFQWQDLREGTKRLAYGLKCRGLICLVGKSGSGKTTLLRSFTSQLEPGLYKTLPIQHTSGTALDLLMHIGHQLGLEPTLIRSRMVHRIQAECAQLGGSRITPLLVIDEAHLLTNQALNELRLLIRSDLDAVRNFILILSGHDDLESRLRLPWLLPLKQRVTTWIRLAPLSPEEAALYLHHRLKIAGVPLNLFSPEATFALSQLSGGLLRPLDTLAHHALLACALDAAKLVTADHVRLAAEEVSL